MWPSLPLLFLPLSWAAQAPTFVPPSTSPTSASSNYVGQNNGTLSVAPIVPGLVFDRFIQVWLENTDFATASSSPIFQKLAQQGITLSKYFALTHPSQPNYVAAAGGSFWGLADDDFHTIPSNISTIVDLLEAADISWASYQENMPSDGFTGLNFASHDYLSNSGTYTFYWRKHNPTVSYESVINLPECASRHRNFNDFAADITSEALPQWMWITPNIVNDAHDTTIDFTSDWLEYFLVPLLDDCRFNPSRTLILLTFDETETYGINNNVFSLLLGSAIPENLVGTTDSTYYTHYSSLSTVQNNWELGSLGRGDTNKTMANVFEVVAEQTGYTNQVVTNIPLTNLTGTIPGPLNSNSGLVTPYPPPDLSAIGAGGGPVFVSS